MIYLTVSADCFTWFITVAGLCLVWLSNIHVVCHCLHLTLFFSCYLDILFTVPWRIDGWVDLLVQPVSKAFMINTNRPWWDSVVRSHALQSAIMSLCHCYLVALYQPMNIITPMCAGTSWLAFDWWQCVFVIQKCASVVDDMSSHCVNIRCLLVVSVATAE